MGVLSCLINGYHNSISEFSASYASVDYFGFLWFHAVRTFSVPRHLALFLGELQVLSSAQMDFTTVLCLYLLASTFSSRQSDVGHGQILALACRLRFGFVWPPDAETSLRVAFKNLQECPAHAPSAIQLRTLLLYLETQLAAQAHTRQGCPMSVLPAPCSASVSVGTFAI